MSQHHRDHRRESKFVVFLRTYPVEIIAALAVSLGLFLLLEQMNIRASVYRWISAGTQNVLHVFGHLSDSVALASDRLTVSDVLGLILILAAMVAIFLRVRWRLIRTPSLTTLLCPRCRGSIHRVHRRLGDRMISWFVLVHRYRCSNRECRWSGLRVATSGRSPEPTLSVE